MSEEHLPMGEKLPQGYTALFEVEYEIEGHGRQSELVEKTVYAHSPAGARTDAEKLLKSVTDECLESATGGYDRNRFVQIKTAKAELVEVFTGKEEITELQRDSHLAPDKV